MIYKEFVKRVTFPLISRKSGISGVGSKLRGLEKSQYWSLDKILAFQCAKLRDLAKHAYEQTSFYKNRFDEAGFNPYGIKTPDDLRKLPELSKNDIRKSGSSLLAKKVSITELQQSATGGTTGVKIEFYLDERCVSARQAALLRFERWAGWDIGERIGLVWPATADYVGHHTLKAKIRNELYGRQVVFPAAVLSDAAVGRYVKQIVNKKPTLIRGFPSPMYEIAKYILEHRIKIDVKGVITTGEPLFMHQRKTIQHAFNCKVMDAYRTREAGPVAQQCEELRGLHISSECEYIEIRERDGFQRRTGDILITDLESYAMPLIRYNIGDMGRISFEACACGRNLPMLESISGRTADIFVGPDGRKIMAITLVLYLVDEAPGLLGQVQIVQDRLDHIVIKMTPDPLPTEEIKAYQKRKVKELFGPQMNVSFQIVNQIPRMASGKYAFTICKVENKHAS